MRDSVTVEVYRGTGAYGPIYDPPQTVRCRVENGNKLVRDATGQQVVSSARLFCDPETVATVGSRVAIGAAKHTVLQVLEQSGPSSLSHKEVVLT
jgi:hypothetical protein